MKNLKSPDSKKNVMKILRCFWFYSCYIRNLHVSRQPFYDVFKDSTLCHRTHEHDKLFQTIKDRISGDTFPAVSSTDYPIHIHMVSSNIESGLILIQQFPKEKRTISYNSSFFWQSWTGNVYPPQGTLWNCLHSTSVWTLQHWITISDKLPLWSQTDSSSVGT